MKFPVICCEFHHHGIYSVLPDACGEQSCEFRKEEGRTCCTDDKGVPLLPEPDPHRSDQMSALYF